MVLFTTMNLMLRIFPVLSFVLIFFLIFLGVENLTADFRNSNQSEPEVTKFDLDEKSIDFSDKSPEIKEFENLDNVSIKKKEKEFETQKLQKISETKDKLEQDIDGIAVAVLGRPNVGKSTLINRILGEERVLSVDLPGTTRDTIFIPFEREGQRYTLIDTAGIRRKRSVNEKIEKFSIIKAISALEDSQVVILVLDAHEGVTEQDATLLGMIADKGRSLLIAINN